MSLSSRWSFFSKNKDVKDDEVKERHHDCNEEKQNNSGDEVVFSINKEEQGKQEVQEEVYNDKTVTDDMKNASLYDKVNDYLKTRKIISDGNGSDDKNSHYKGLHTEVMPTMPVLFIEEFVPPFPNTNKSKKSVSVTDWRAYVYYDSWRGVYVVNGTRRRDDEQGLEKRFPDIFMTFKSKSSLAFYLRKSTCSWKHKLSVTLYSMYRNVIHLSNSGAMPSFHSIHHCRNKFRTELFGYDDCLVTLKEFESYLKILKDGADDGFLFRPMKYV